MKDKLFFTFFTFLLLFSIIHYSYPQTQTWYWLKEGAYVKYVFTPVKGYGAHINFEGLGYEFYFWTLPDQYYPKDVNKSDVKEIMMYVTGDRNATYTWIVSKITDKLIYVNVSLEIFSSSITLHFFGFNFTTIKITSLPEKYIKLETQVAVDPQTLYMYYQNKKIGDWIYWRFREDFNSKKLIVVFNTTPTLQPGMDIPYGIGLKGPISETGSNFTIKFKNYVIGPDRIANSTKIEGRKYRINVLEPAKSDPIYPSDIYYYDMVTGILIYKRVKDPVPVDTIQRQIFRLYFYTASGMIIEDTNIDFDIPVIGGKESTDFNWILIVVVASAAVTISVILIRKIRW